MIFGGVFYNAVTAVPFLVDTPDRKVAYTFHCYEPFIFTHQGAYWVDGMPLDFRIGYPKTVEEYREATKIVDSLPGCSSPRSRQQKRGISRYTAASTA